MDGIDAVLVDFSVSPLMIIASYHKTFPKPLKTRLRALYTPSYDEINKLGILDRELGKLFAQASLAVLKKGRIAKNKVLAIGCHGQTIRHFPFGKNAFTLQIGDPNTIAHLTGITTIADFRRRDIAAEGQGAPLVPAFHKFAFYSSKHDVALINIGGIANITVIPKNKKAPLIGFDIGPGNALLDAWAYQNLKCEYDHHGALAQQGKINQKLLQKLLNDSYFKITPPKSTGKEYFNLTWLRTYLFPNLKAVDVQATLTELTALTITQTLNCYAKKTQQVFICGGGAYNNYLLKRLQKLNPQRKILSTATLGIAPHLVEATAFAWLAQQTLTGKPVNLTSVTGAKKPIVLGGIYQSN